MEISDPKIKKFLIFSQKKAFLIFPEAEPCTFQAQARKVKENLLPKKFLTFWAMELSSSNIKNFLLFFEKKPFLYFGTQKPRKNTLHLRKQNFLIFQETSYIRITF